MKNVQTVERKKVAILIGPYMSGKTTLLFRLMGKYSFVGKLPTIGIDSKRINLSYNNDQYSVRLWDTPGRERFRGSIEKLLKGVDLILLLFTEKTMKEAIEQFYPVYIENRKE